MDYYVFLNKNDQVLLQVAWKLVTAPDNTIYVSDITEWYGLSHYKLSNLLNDLKSGIAQVTDDAVTVKMTNGKLSSRGFNCDAFRELQLVLLHQALPFQTFEFDYVNRLHQSRQTSLDQHYISKSTYYKTRAQIEEYLIENDMCRHSSKLNIHREFMTRTQITKVYYFYYIGIADPFPEQNELVAKLMNVVLMTYRLMLSPSEKSRLRLFLHVQLMRIKNQHFVNLRDVLQLPHGSQPETLKTFFVNHFGYIHGIDCESEVAYLLSYLSSQSYDNTLHVEFINSIDDCFTLARRRFMVELQTAAILDHQEVTDEQLKVLVARLLRMSRKLLIFDFQYDSMEWQGSTQKVKSDFPGLQRLADRLTELICNIFNLDINKLEYDKISYNFLVELVNGLPPQSIKDRIQICVDFAIGNALRDYVVSNLQHFFFGNVDVGTSLTKQTDIYLSDLYNHTVNGVLQITVPIVYDFNALQRLAEKVSEVREAKLAAIMAPDQLVKLAD